MDTITPFPDPKSIEAEACAWIAQLDGGNLSQEDLAALREWMSRSRAHRQAIENLSVLWDDLNIFTELAVPRPARTAAARKGFASRFPGRLARPVSLAIAGGLLLAAAGALLLNLPGNLIQPMHTVEQGPAAPSPARQSDYYVTDIGQQKSVELDDGSRVILNTDSRIEIAFSAQHRDIRLVRGEAMFEVSQDGARPFRVYAGNGMVRAIGTAFTVYLRDADSVSVTVAHGAVELASIPSPDSETGSDRNRTASASPLAKIRAGQSATFGVDIQSIQTLEHAELSRQLSWRRGMLHFEGEPLSQAVREVSRYTTQRIVILDPALRDLRIGGYFKAGETDAMFEALESSFGVRVERVSEDLVHLRIRH